MPAGIHTESRTAHPAKAFAATLAMPGGRITCSRRTQPLNASVPTVVTVAGMDTDVMQTQSRNASAGIETVPDGIATDAAHPNGCVCEVAAQGEHTRSDVTVGGALSKVGGKHGPE